MKRPGNFFERTKIIAIWRVLSNTFKTYNFNEMKFIRNIFLALLIISGISSCEDKFLDLEPLSNPTDVTFFADANQLQLALNAIHGSLWNPNTEGMPVTFYMDAILTDDMLYRITDEHWGLRALSNSVHDPSSGFGGMYSEYYKAIGRCNNMLQNMERAQETMEAAEYNDFKAQAITLRAYYYHFLIHFFGDVPFLDFLPTTTDGGFLPRTSKDEIVTRLLSDLDEAAATINTGLTGAQERVTLSVVQGLKARIALYAGRFDVAASAADAAISAASAQGLSLHPNYTEMFTLEGENNNETMLRIPFDEAWGRANRFTLRMGFRFGSIYSQMLPTQNLIDAYPTINGLPIDEDPEYDYQNPWENRDPRLKASIVLPQDEWAGYVYESHRDSLQTWKFVDGVKKRVLNEDCRSAQWPAGLTGYLWEKYVDEASLGANISKAYNDVSLMRLGEIYLIKAEAEIESNGSMQEAADAINMLRERAWGGADYPAVTAGSQSEMRKILRMERRVELANEGFRYIDMLRWGIAEKVRNEPLIGRILDYRNATAASVPTIDEDGVVTYGDRSEYDNWHTLLIDGVVVDHAYDSRLNGNWQNAHERDFTAPRDYLMPIPQEEIELYEANGFTLSQNPGYN